MVFDPKTRMATYVGYGNYNDGQVNDGKLVNTTCFMVKDLKLIAGVCVNIDI